MARPAKPTRNPGAGRSWVYNAKTGKWVAKRNTPASPTTPTTPATPAVTTPPPVDVKAVIASDVKAGDNAIAADVTDSNRLLGFGYGNAAGYASAGDIFGGTSPGAGYGVRDAMGRTISGDIDPATKLMETDVYAADGSLQNIAGTQLGNTITAARRNAADMAEGRSSRGTGAGGVRNAENTATGVRNSTGVNDLLGRFQSTIRDLGTKRLGAITDSQTNRSGNTSGYAPPVTPPAPPTVPPKVTPKVPKVPKVPNAGYLAKHPLATPGKKIGEIRKNPAGVKYKWNGKNWRPI